MPDLMSRTLRMMNVSGVTLQDIYEMLVGEGLTQRQAYYTYVGARMIYQDSKPILLPPE